MTRGIDAAFLAALVALSHSVGAAGQMAGTQPSTSIEQLPRGGSPGPLAQIPKDVVADDDARPEIGIGVDAAGDSDALYRDVATAWQAIRARGLQPTPELLAQAVGPDNLARFLSTFEGADRVFRSDVDGWPLPPPGATTLPRQEPGR